MSDGLDKLEAQMGADVTELGASDGLDFILDVPLAVTVELGRAEMTIAKVLALGDGAVIELDKAAGEPLDIRVNDHLVARGEAVVVNDRFGVRLTEVVRGKARDTTS